MTLLAKAIAFLAETHDNVSVSLLYTTSALSFLTGACDQHRLAIGPLRNLIQRYAPGYLTNMHCIFLRTCIKSECWDQALPILDAPLTEVDRSVSRVDEDDIRRAHQ